MTPLVRRLANTPAFETLPEVSLQALATCLVEETVPAGGLLLRSGAPADGEVGLYLVLEGSFAVRVPRQGGGFVQARIIEPGELVGLLGLISDQPHRRANVVAMSDALVAHMPRSAFLALYQGADRMSVCFLRAVGRQLSRDLRRVDGVLQAAVAGGRPSAGLT